MFIDRFIAVDIRQATKSPVSMSVLTAPVSRVIAGLSPDTVAGMLATEHLQPDELITSYKSS